MIQGPRGGPAVPKGLESSAEPSACRQQSEEEVNCRGLCRSFSSSILGRSNNLCLPHPLDRSQSHGSTYLQGRLGNVVWLCAQEAKRRASEQLRHSQSRSAQLYHLLSSARCSTGRVIMGEDTDGSRKRGYGCPHSAPLPQ